MSAEGAPVTHRRTTEAREAVRERVRAHTERHHGIFRRGDLADLGIDPEIIRSFMHRGWWKRLHHGVYVDTDVLSAAQDPLERMRIFTSAAIAALPGPAYAFGPSAAVLQGLVVDRTLTHEVSILRPLHSDQRALHRRVTSPSDLGGVTVHRHAVHEHRLIDVDGIPSVDRAIAAITTAARSRPMWALATLDSYAWRNPAALHALPRLIEEWRGLRGLGHVREAAALARDGAQTALESVSRYQFMMQGLPEPRLQVAFHDAEGLIGYADMAWEDLGVIGEADGLLKYQTREDVIAEKRREDRLRALGWIVVRWTWDEIIRTPWVVVERIQRAAALASIRTHRSA